YTLGLLQGLGCEILYANHDIYRNEGSPKEVMDIQTFYEKQYLEKGKPITYLKFTVN
ncbi:MAG: tRNA (guanosine(46)-N7)-methyltransferase TrmB, partial [Eudoraea sp.]